MFPSILHSLACGAVIVGLMLAIPETLYSNDWSEVQKITAADGNAHDEFGISVDIAHNVVIIGAKGDDVFGYSSGSAYIFSKSDGGWQQTRKLIASDGAAVDYFGYSVGVFGNTAIIGAVGDDDLGISSGAAYLFENIDGTWSQTMKLHAYDGAAMDEFGASVAIAEDVMIISSDYDDDQMGSAIVYTKSNGAWSWAAKLRASDRAVYDHFGYSVSISADIAVVGAPNDDDNGANSGSAYIYWKNGEYWPMKVKLCPLDGAAGDEFGTSVSNTSEIVVIGAPSDDDQGFSSGSVYIFEKISGNWIQTAKLTPSDGQQGNLFGGSVSISGLQVVVGARNDNDKGSYSGSAYVFEKKETGWLQTSKLTASDGADSDHFGQTVSIFDDTAIIGANCDDDKGVDSGSAYFFNSTPIVVHFASFAACYKDQGISIEWRTVSEIEIAGFNVLRRNQMDNVFQKINKSMITAMGTSNCGADYRYLDSAALGGEPQYALEIVSLDGTCSKSAPISVSGETGIQKNMMPEAYVLHPNFPNPFNPQTTIGFDLPSSSMVSLLIYDAQGHLVRMLVNSCLGGGTHSVVWNGTDEKGRKVSSGLYFCRMKAGMFEQTCKMTLLY